MDILLSAGVAFTPDGKSDPRPELFFDFTEKFRLFRASPAFGPTGTRVCPLLFAS